MKENVKKSKGLFRGIKKSRVTQLKLEFLILSEGGALLLLLLLLHTTYYYHYYYQHQRPSDLPAHQPPGRQCLQQVWERKQVAKHCSPWRSNRWQKNIWVYLEPNCLLYTSYWRMGVVHIDLELWFDTLRNSSYEIAELNQIPDWKGELHNSALIRPLEELLH